MSEFSLKAEDFYTWAQPLSMGPIIWEVWTNVERASFFLFLLFLFLISLVCSRMQWFSPNWKEACLYYRIFILTQSNKPAVNCCTCLSSTFPPKPKRLFCKRKLNPGSTFICPVCQCCFCRVVGFVSIFSSARALSLRVAVKIMCTKRVFLK